MVEFLLFGAKPRGDMKPLAKALIARHGSLAGVLAAGPEELAKAPGMGEASVAALKVVAEAAKRLARKELAEQPVISSGSSCSPTAASPWGASRSSTSTCRSPTARTA